MNAQETEQARQRLHRELIAEINAMTPEQFEAWMEQDARDSAEAESDLADLREWASGR